MSPINNPESVKTLPNGSVLVDHGPMRMLISVFEAGKPLPELAGEGAFLAMETLGDLARFLSVIRKRPDQIRESNFPDVVRRMIAATSAMDEPDLTALAAVAGAASDVVADFLIHRGATRVIVNNGGDIAIRLKENESVRVGVKTEIDAADSTYFLDLGCDDGIGGIATSGLGGRSFTKGIATAATVLAESAVMADAAATVIANWTDVEDPAIERRPAEEIYPDTDIAGIRVTTSVGKLPAEKAAIALERGLKKACSLCERGLIRGALIAAQGKVVWTPSLEPWIHGIEQREKVGSSRIRGKV